MELGQNGHFYGLWISSRNFSKHWAMVNKKLHVAMCPTGEGVVNQNFEAMKQESNSADSVIFWSVTKISQPLK